MRRTHFWLPLACLVLVTPVCSVIVQAQERTVDRSPWLVRVTSAARIPPGTQQGAIHLGFNDNQPAVFTLLRPGVTIKISQVTYDGGGYVSGYQEEILLGGNVTVIKISLDPNLKVTDRAYRYSAEVNGTRTSSPTVDEWEKTEHRGYLGLSPKDLGGVILISKGPLQINLINNFSYDSFGRRQMASQKFTHEGVDYEIAYAGHVFDRGRLVGYTATVTKGK